MSRCMLSLPAFVQDLLTRGRVGVYFCSSIGGSLPSRVAAS